MLNTIAVMNTKGGVGKSTMVLALAETLAADYGKNVLVIDSDAQASVSSMLMSISGLYALQHEGRTIVDYLVASVLQGANPDWSPYIISKVSDVDDAQSVYLFPSDMQLTLFEREVSKESRHTALRSTIGRLLAEVAKVFDIVLIDCPPGLSVLTESWLREADFHLSPTKADYVSICGLEVFRRFKALNPEMGFAQNLGVVVNLKDPMSETDEEYHRWLLENTENRCFEQAVPRMGVLQDAARHRSQDRSYFAKYPGAAGQAIRALTAELVNRITQAKNAGLSTTPGAPPIPPSAPAGPVSVAPISDMPPLPLAAQIPGAPPVPPALPPSSAPAATEASSTATDVSVINGTSQPPATKSAEPPVLVGAPATHTPLSS